MEITFNPSPVRTPVRFVFSAMLVLLPLAAMHDALACAACGCTLSKDWGTQGISAKPGFTADFSYDYINQSQQRFGFGAASPSQINSVWGNGNEVEDYTVTRITTATLNYNSDTWGASAQIPFLQRKHGTFSAFDALTNNVPSPSLSTAYASSSDSGIGDIRLIGRYTGLSADKTSGIIAGLKLPTGSTNANFSDGSALDRSLQIGTGSTDLVLGGFVTGAIDQYGWFAQGTIQHAVATKSIGGADYHPGDAYSLNAGIRYARFGARFTPMLQFNLIHRRADSGAAAAYDVSNNSPLTGGTLLYLAPGALLRVAGGTSIYGFVQLPVYQNVTSLQLSPRYTLTLGAQQSFE